MNKKLLRVALLVAVVAVAGLGAHKAQAKKPVLSDIMLANVEALTRYELPEVVIRPCGKKGGYCWKRSSRLCMWGEYSYYECDFTDNCMDHCTNIVQY
ncbi:MAG: hypothetical protein J6A40_05590 [Bacteroides sp.]|nr:hypothetical protein [Bacteroides sp.]